MATPSETVYIASTAAHTFATTILEKYSIPPDRATLIADSLVLADLRGVDTHGINRLAGYITRIEHGVLAPNPELTFTQKTPVMAHLDAQNTLGFIAASLAIDKGIEMARAYGVGIVAVRRSNHYGMAATYLLRATKEGFAAMAFTNASRSMPAWGSKEPLLGTSPFAVGVPGGEKGDFVLDMSPSVAARGKIRKAARRGEKIPEGYALDAEGRPTTDPDAALGGVVLPIGGPKGSGLAMMMDIFGGVMSGAAFAGEVNDQYKDLERPQNVGHWFLVFRSEVFLDGGLEELRGRMDTLLERVRGSERAAGVERIYTSGEIEAEVEAKRRQEGIPYSRGEIDALNALAESAGVDVRL
ncbi:Malate/L-lactate dehydrogenase [Aspergillus pseudoustus]|uniref:Malate/L-lactate dehydrogenase n=1 Tax=Aspergillus pseudoustus TaxID=1810923 RepID=A0ABR4L1Z0_9EURO